MLIAEPLALVPDHLVAALLVVAGVVLALAARIRRPN